MVDLEKVKIKETGFVHMGGWVWGGVITGLCINTLGLYAPVDVTTSSGIYSIKYICYVVRFMEGDSSISSSYQSVVKL